MATLQSAANAVGRMHRHALNTLGHKVFRGTDAWMAKASTTIGGPVHDAAVYEWTPALEMAAGEIRHELQHILKHQASLPTLQDISPDQKGVSKDENWRIFALYGFGIRSERNCKLCPVTARTLDAIPGVFNAFFSILEPGKHIPRHRGITKGFLRCHLGLVVPKERELCRMNVDGTMVVWEEGKAVIFDDSRPHEVWNDTNERRAVLLIDVPRPMKLHGRIMLSTLMGILKHTYYVKEPIANQRRWEEQTDKIFDTR
jgi:beta-hydroxylase